MALPASGPISMDAIRIELGVPSESPFGINEARLGTYVAINQFSASKPPSSGTASLSDWQSYSQSGGYNSDTFYYDASSAATACAGTPDTTLYWSGSLAIATILYTDSLGTSEASQGYWSDGTDAYFQDCPDGCGDGITSITACEAPPAYNYYTFTPCVGGAGTDYRSITSLALNDVYAFQASPPARQCYQITSITASSNNNDLPTIYGPKTDCNDGDCVQP